MPLISVIIPVYDSVLYLDRCLGSVLGQTHSDLEVLLVDDGSTDGSAALCDAYAEADRRVRVIHQANAGASAARNAALDIASGDYIGFVDSDDWIEPDMYGYLLELMGRYDCQIAEAMLEVAYSSDHSLPRLPERIEVFEAEDILIHYFELNEFQVGMRLYSRQVFEGVRFDVGRINEDVVAGFLALRQASRLVSSNQPKLFYFSNPIGISESPLRQRDLDLLFASERLEELVGDSANERLRQLALTRARRAPFTLLVKMAVYGCSDELDRRSIAQRLKALLRPHFGFLMRQALPLNRKLLLVGCRFCYPLVRTAGAVYRRVLAARRR